MDTNWLEDFVCFGRVLNFTKAAAERNITQSAYSRRIMSLEHWVGAELIDRRTFPATLSEAGIEFLPVAKRMLQGLHRSRDEIRAKTGTSEDTIRFAAPHSISIHNLMPVISYLESKVPELKSHVVSDNLHNCFDLLVEKNCDFLMCYKSPNVSIMLDAQAFEHIEIGTDRLLPVYAPSDDGKQRPRLPGWSDEPLPYLQYSRGSFLGSVVEQIFSKKPPNLAVKHVNAFSEALKNLCIHGAGIAWLPEASIKRELTEGKLLIAGDENWSIDLNVVVYTEAQLHHQNAAKVWELLKGSTTSDENK